MRNSLCRLMKRQHREHDIKKTCAARVYGCVIQCLDFWFQFKILLLCYRCLNGSAPQYLTSLLSPHKPPRNLRSSRDVLKLNVPCSKRL